MKRTGNLWPSITSFANLSAAATTAGAGKRRRPDVAAFNLNLEWELLALQRELISRTYRPGPYRTFMIEDPKPRRHISAAPFRDRVVHHALTRVVEPVFEKRFSNCSFACRKGFGTHQPSHGRKKGRAFIIVLKCDIRKYFASIDHEILKGYLARALKCKPTLDLAGKIIDGSNEQETAIAYYPGDDLFSLKQQRGLPLGNQTSQFLANVYLDPLDQFMVRELKPRIYARYVDDFVLFDNSKDRLREIFQRDPSICVTLRLDLHPESISTGRTTA